MFRLSETGVEFDGNIAMPQWQQGMRFLSQAKRSLSLWTADFIRVGRSRFGDAVVSETIEQMEFDLLDVTRATAIASLADGVRNSKLTSEHYWVLAKASLSEEAQRFWAAAAVEHSLSPALLQKSIEAGRVLTEPGKAPKGGIATIHGIRQAFDLWFRNVGREKAIAEMPKAQKEELFQELREPVRVGLRLAKDLGIPLEKVL